MTKRYLLVTVMLLALAYSTMMGSSYTTNFNSMSSGTINGQDGWFVQNPGTQDEAVGSGLWRISNKFSDGIIVHAASPSLSASAGEAALKTFRSEFRWKTAAATGDDSMVQISPDGGGGGRWGGRLDITNFSAPATFDAHTVPAGVRLHWDTITNDVDSYIMSPALIADAWYRTVIEITFVPGTNGTAPNDIVTIKTYDSAGTLVWDVPATPGVSTWECAGYGGVQTVNRLVWRTRWNINHVTGSGILGTPAGFYFDDVSIVTAACLSKVTPNMLTTGDTRWGVDSSISPFGPLSANGAPAGFGTSSFTATVTANAAEPNCYRSLRLIPEAIFGHTVMLSDIASMSYMTKNIDSTMDWRYTIYTKKTLSNDVGWYHSRLSGSFGSTPNDWKTWSTDSLTFDSRRGSPWTESYGQTWSTVTSADPTDVVWFFDLILGAGKDPSGSSVPGTSQLDAVKITLINGEDAILDLEKDATLSLDAPSASLYVKTNEAFVIDMNVKDLPTEVKGCQALLGYDDAMLNAGSVAVGGGVWDQLISETWSIVGAQGKINTAIGVNSDSSAGTSAPGTVAKITLIAGSTDGSTQLVFLPNVSDVEDTRLADMFGNSIFPTKVNSTNIIIDGTAPTVVLSDDHADAIVRDADTVVITATFTDATGIDETTNPPKITIAGGGVTDGLMTKSSNLVWTYSWNVPAGNDGTATVSISAFDMAGNPNVSATGKTAYTIDNIAPTATLSVTQFGLPIGTAIQGAVDIAVTAINGTGTTGSVKSVTVTGPPTLPVTGTYSVTIGSSTPNGLYTVTAIVTDQAGNETTKTATFTVNKNEISGTVAMDFVGTGTRVVTFVLNGTTTMTADVDSGGAYKLTNVPDDITAVSAKTAWTLRRKITVSATNGQITANFMGAAKLLAGDINGTNSININDYSLLKAKWYTTDLAADVNGDGVVQGEDYILMKSSWFKLGDAF